MTETTYCMEHETLETIEGVTKVRPFMVEVKGILWPTKTNRSANEVWGFTDQGCNVHFMGGAQWHV